MSGLGAASGWRSVFDVRDFIRSLTVGFQIFWDEVPYASVHIESAIIIRIMHGELPLDMDAIVVDEDIRQLFKRCWVADPDVRVDMNGCANAVQSVLERMQLA